MVAKCENGHWYDSSLYETCPHCKNDSGKLGLLVDDVEDDDKTVSLAAMDISLDFDESIDSIVQQSEIPIDIPMGVDGSSEDDDKTMAFGFFGMANVQPVTGWLVNIKGEDKGQDYRLHSGRNFIGRGASDDIVLGNDTGIALGKHCSITYEPNGNNFYLSSEDGNVVYLNDQVLERTLPLTEGDKITLGETELIFVPYCKEGRKWENE